MRSLAVTLGTNSIERDISFPGKTILFENVSKFWSDENILINSIGNSAKLGKGEWCVLESDESDGSFLQLPFTYSIITNIDEEHLEHYGSLNNLKKSFIEFAEKTPTFGKTLICLDNINNKSIINKIKNQNIVTYGLNEKSNFRIKNIKLRSNISLFDLEVNLPNQGKKIYKSVCIIIIKLDSSLTVRFNVLYPICVKIKVLPDSTFEILKLPSKSVETPILVPSIITVAPERGTALSSVTIPLIDWDCILKASANINKKEERFLKIIVFIIFIELKD